MNIQSDDLLNHTGIVAYAEFVYQGTKAKDKIGEKISTMCFIRDGKIWINATSETVPQKDIIKWSEI